MNEKDLEIYEKVRSGQTGYFEKKRGLIAVWGKEAVQFLNGLITNDVAKMEDGGPQVSDAAAAQHWQAVSPEDADRLDPVVTIPNASKLVRAAMTPGADLVAWASPEPDGMLTLVP